MLPTHPIAYILERDRGDAAAPVWTLTPVPYLTAQAMAARHDAEMEKIRHDPPAVQGKFVEHQLERFYAGVQAVTWADGTTVQDRAALQAVVERLDIAAFTELLNAPRSAVLLKAGAKNWSGSSSNGTVTPPTQEPQA